MRVRDYVVRVRAQGYIVVHHSFGHGCLGERIVRMIPPPRRRIHRRRLRSSPWRLRYWHVHECVCKRIAIHTTLRYLSVRVQETSLCHKTIGKERACFVVQCNSRTRQSSSIALTLFPRPHGEIGNVEYMMLSTHVHCIRPTLTVTSGHVRFCVCCQRNHITWTCSLHVLRCREISVFARNCTNCRHLKMKLLYLSKQTWHSNF